MLSRACAVVMGCTLLARCGGGPAGPSSTGDPTIAITASGPVPSELRIPAGGKVLFVNNDVRPHGMSSDPVQVHTDCPAINDVGTLAPGQSRSTGVLSVARTCGFHDHMNEFDATWKGRIIVQ